jgi:hypothetical protein
MVADNLERAVQYSVEGIKAAMYLNGGGAVALMTLMGAAGKGEAGASRSASPTSRLKQFNCSGRARSRRRRYS